MAKRLSLRIDVSKIDKSKIYEGKKGKYLDAVVFINDEPDEYGNIGMIVQSVSKEEREKGIKGAILGNAKEFGSPNPTPAETTAPASNAKPIADDLPF